MIRPDPSLRRPPSAWADCRVEIRLDHNTFEFVVTQRFPNGLSETERFETLGRCRARVIALERRLETERWTNSGPPLYASMETEVDETPGP